MAISRSIVEAVRSLDPPGRFLEKNPESGLWNDIGDRKAIEKVSESTLKAYTATTTHSCTPFFRLHKRFAMAPLL
jgi:hypothetical protein